MCSTKYGRLTAWILGFVICASLPTIAEEGDDAWKKERAKLQHVIDARVEAEVKKNVTRKEVIKTLGWKAPVKPPKKKKEDVIAAVEKRIDAEAKKRFPEAERMKFAKEAAKIYQLYKVGENISFTIRGGVGTNTNVSGKLYQVTELRIRVGSRWIVRSDISKETAAHFYADVSEHFQQRYIRVKNHRYDAKIDAFKRSRRKDLIPKALAAAGYIVKPSRSKKSIKPADWVAKSDVVEYLYKRKRKAYKAKIQRQITEEVFAANGFLFVAEQNEWMPKKQAESIREKLRRILEEKRQKEEEAKQPKQPGLDIMGEGAAPGMEPGMEPGMTPGGAP
jgi:hypothetical protein